MPIARCLVLGSRKGLQQPALVDVLNERSLRAVSRMTLRMLHVAFIAHRCCKKRAGPARYGMRRALFEQRRAQLAAVGSRPRTWTAGFLALHSGPNSRCWLGCSEKLEQNQA